MSRIIIPVAALLMFFATISVAEAKVCLAVDQRDCGISVTVKTEDTNGTNPSTPEEKHKCPAEFNLTEILQPENENQTCSCLACEDEDGMHYKCSCAEVEAPCTPGDGFWNSQCCTTDADCKATSEFPLYCFNGVCKECGELSDCKIGSRFYKKYGAGATGCVLATHLGHGSWEMQNKVTSVEKLKAEYKIRIACRNGECITPY